MPLSHRSKLLFIVESSASLLTVGIHGELGATNGRPYVPLAGQKWSVRNCNQSGYSQRLIAAQDIGAFAAAAFAEPERFHGHEIDLAADSPALPDVAAKMTKVTGKPVSAVTLFGRRRDAGKTQWRDDLPT